MRRGGLRHLVVREGKNTGERMLSLFSTSAVSHLDELKDRLEQSGIPVTSLLWFCHDGLSDVAAIDSSLGGVRSYLERTFNDRAALERFLFRSCGSGYHPSGTVPMRAPCPSR